MVKLNELREQYIITKSLLLAETILTAIVDIRHRNSDLFDIRAMLETKPYSIMAKEMGYVRQVNQKGGTVGNDNGTNQG